MNAAPNIHHGHNVKCIREILGIKQDTLATQLGLSQQAISSLEQKETLGLPMLNKVTKALGVSADVIKNFREEAAINNMSSTLHDKSGSVFYNPTFKPIDKIIELYERMIKDKDELIYKLMHHK